jgi:tRNA(Ile)-lysidine synthase
MVLLHALARLRSTAKFELFAHGVDHGLRAEAAAELDVAAGFAAELGVPFTRSRLEVAAGGNLQARARSARYVALRERAAELGAELIATAHHADDRAETVLLRLLRGTSPRGLGVLPARSDNLVRPLIRAQRRDIAAHAERHRVPYSEDPSNRNPRFLRNRVRAELIPLLLDLAPGIVTQLNALADETLAASREFPEVAGPHFPKSLGRAQRLELLRLLERPSRSARIQLADGHDVRVDPLTREIRVERRR